MDSRPDYVIDAVPNKHLPGGLKPGRSYEVDLRSAYVRSAIEAGHLKPVEGEPILDHGGEVIGLFQSGVIAPEAERAPEGEQDGDEPE